VEVSDEHDVSLRRPGEFARAKATGRGRRPKRREDGSHYVVAVPTNLGYRYSDASQAAPTVFRGL
jgi:hypothetical protein